jgi:hypothetical protein
MFLTAQSFWSSSFNGDNASSIIHNQNSYLYLSFFLKRINILFLSNNKSRRKREKLTNMLAKTKLFHFILFFSQLPLLLLNL